METDYSKLNLTDFEGFLVSGDYDRALEFVKKILNEDIEIKVLYDEILKKSLYKVGELWEANKITVATEHLASAIVETLLSEVYFKIITKDKIDKSVVVACTENEFHQIGIKMVSDVFAMNGWRVIFLGANITTDIVLDTVETEKPDILAISLSVPFNLPILDMMLSKIRERFPDQYILVGGQAFLHGGFDVLNKYEKVIYKSDLKDLEDFLKTNV